MFISEFCSLMNLGMYIINKLLHGYFACSIFIHKNKRTSAASEFVLHNL